MTIAHKLKSVISQALQNLDISEVSFVVEHPTKINSIEINKTVFLNSIFI